MALQVTRTAGLAAVLAASLSGAPAHAQAQLVREGVPSRATQAEAQEEGYGTASDVVVTLSAQDFNPFQGTEGSMVLLALGRSCSVGKCGWFASVKVPSGASLRAIELSACDNDSANMRSVQAAIFSVERTAGGLAVVSPFADSGAAPGCGAFRANLSAPVTVSNFDREYVVDVLSDTAATPDTLNWSQVRVYYRLQVSPPPATATFPNDVPASHPFFRFVEALAAAGITGGCSPGAYCPDEPVTRGQMAVFLSTALGLHFPN